MVTFQRALRRSGVPLCDSLFSTQSFDPARRIPPSCLGLGLPGHQVKTLTDRFISFGTAELEVVCTMMTWIRAGPARLSEPTAATVMLGLKNGVAQVVSAHSIM